MYLAVVQYSIPDFSVPVFSLPGSGSGSSAISETVFTFTFIILGDDSAITPELYKYVSDRYAWVYRNVQNSYEYFNNAVVHVAQMDNVEAKLDLMKPLRLSIRSLEQSKFTSQLYSAAIKINSHIEDRSEQRNLNLWLSDNGVKVLRDWASLCSETGTTIEEENIQG